MLSVRPPPRKLPAKLGDYTLVSHIGRGGMADTYLAVRETGFGASRRVVVKEVLPHLAAREDFAQALVAEAKLAAPLDHANVAKVEDLARDEGLFVAMEYVEGIDLRELLRRCARRKLPMPIEFSLRIVSELLRGLGFAHRFRGPDGRRLGLVHRDVSPSNVLLSFEGEVKLCDFGIARAGALAPDAEEALLGKAGYMSPEHARGEAIDARSDVFAAGVVLWELLAGRRLYKAGPGERLVDLAKRAEIPPLPQRGIAGEADLARVVSRALKVDPAARYPSAAAMLEDLEEAAAIAGLVASSLKFGAWLGANFGDEVLGPRRESELAALRSDEPTPSGFSVVERSTRRPIRRVVLVAAAAIALAAGVAAAIHARQQPVERLPASDVAELDD